MSGHFVVFKHLRSHSIFMNNGVYGVLGLYSPLEELVHTVPAYVDACLLPFGERIIIDGILTSPGMKLSLRAGLRRIFQKQYAEARDQSRIRTSLVSATRQLELVSGTPGKRRKPTPVRRSSIVGVWRITETELWDRAALDLVEDAIIRFDSERLGELAMIALQADLDYRIDTGRGKPSVEFSFAGDDDGDPCSGRGWAVLEDDDVLRGRLYIHHGDDSTFEARRVDRRQTKSRRRGRRRGG